LNHTPEATIVTTQERQELERALAVPDSGSVPISRTESAAWLAGLTLANILNAGVLCAFWSVLAQ
jgi:hypothetical protein